MSWRLCNPQNYVQGFFRDLHTTERLIRVMARAGVTNAKKLLPKSF